MKTPTRAWATLIAVALITSSCAVSWGRNPDGQLGDGTTTNRSTPGFVLPPSQDWLILSAGGQHTCGVKTDRTLYCWGSNDRGQLGDGTTTGASNPVQEATLATDWKTVSTGASFTCGVKTGGAVLCWGQNAGGQLGDGTTTDRSSPVQESTVATDWATVSAAPGHHTCGVKTSGTLHCWGHNSFGQLGDGTTTARLTPTQEATMATDWKTASAGNVHSCGMKTGATVYCWGSNGGQLGDGTTTARLTPTQEATLATDWAQLGVGSHHTCGIKTGATLHCWGLNSTGSLGDGTTTTRLTPTQEATLATDWAQLGLGLWHTCGIKTGGTLHCWGLNDRGQLGDGTTTDHSSPVQVGTETNWLTVSGGAFHTVGTQWFE